LFVWLYETNQMNQINQINKTNQINETDQINKTDQSGDAYAFGLLLCSAPAEASALSFNRKRSVINC
jgi:hypothetical protein